MRVIRDYKYCPEIAKGALLVVGNFDALHVGHRHVIESAKKIALKEGLKLNLMTFDPHPMTILNESIKKINIISLESKIKMMEELGVDFLFLQKFDKEFSQKPSEDFVKEIKSFLDMKILVVGNNFYFGFNKEGNIEKLSAMSQDLGFSLVSVPLVKLTNGDQVSSSAIRDYLMRGDITNASRMLGYNYFISGNVVEGSNIGSKIGFPTANIEIDELLLPKLGVYTASVYIEGDNFRYTGMANLGTKPSFNDYNISLEVNIFDFTKDILGKEVKVMFHKHIRDQKKFSSVESIASQLSKDKIKAQSYFSEMNV